MSPTTEQLETLERVRKLLCAALGDDTPDGYIITDYGIGIAEPGYWNESESVWVLGNWNPKRYPREGEPPLTREENLPVRLADALERIGVVAEWLDEWVQCSHCYRIFRSQANSYSWRMAGLFIESDGDYLCAEDARDNPEWWLDEFINEPTKAITLDVRETLEELGFEQYNGTYESGFHPGQNDNPTQILETALKFHNEGIFTIPSVGQFDIDFCLWVRNTCDYAMCDLPVFPNFDSVFCEEHQEYEDNDNDN